MAPPSTNGPAQSTGHRRRTVPHVAPERGAERLERRHAELRERGAAVVGGPVVVDEVGSAEAEEARLQVEAPRVREEVEEVAGEEPAGLDAETVVAHLGAVAGDRDVVEERWEVDAAPD